MRATTSKSWLRGLEISLLGASFLIFFLTVSFQGVLAASDTEIFGELVEGLAEIGMPDGVCGPLKAILDGPVGIVLGDGDSYSIPDTVEHYEPGDYPPIAIATTHGNGRVVAISQEGFFTENNINRYDNLRLGVNAIEWLDPQGNRRILYDDRSWPYVGYGGQSVYSGLGVSLLARGYMIDRLPVGEQITAAILGNYDVYMICTSWYAFSPAEIDGVVHFVENGGGLFLTGVGWSWVGYQGPLSEYPMNRIASQFEIWFMDGYVVDPTDYIGDPGHPIYYTFYPLNQSPAANFDFAPNDPIIEMDVQFTDESQDPDGTIVSWSWDFGDESLPSSEQHPHHAFQSPGDKVVTLIVTDNSGSTDTKQKTLTVWKAIGTSYTPSTDGFAFENYPYGITPEWFPDWASVEIAAHCLGMTMTSLLYDNTNQDVPTPDSTGVHGLVCNPTGANVPPWQPYPFFPPGFGGPPCFTRFYIEYYQLYLLLDATCKEGLRAAWELAFPTQEGTDQWVTLQFNKLMAQIETSPKPILIPQHALLAYRVLVNAQSVAEANLALICVYDPNYPLDDKRCIDLVKTGQGLWCMSSYDGKDVFTVYDICPLWQLMVNPLSVFVFSPVDLCVTDPDGLSFSKTASGIPTAFYIEGDYDGDEELDDFVLISDGKTGIYLIKVIPEPGASPTNTFSLYICAEGECLVLATGVPIADIPEAPYFLSVTADGIAVATPQQVIQVLTELVQSFNFPHGLANSLIVKLETALISLQNGNKTAAINKLNAFMNEVAAQMDKKITQDQAARLTAWAKWMIESIDADPVAPSQAPVSIEIAVFPNPVRDIHSATFRVTGATADLVEAIGVTIFDLAGRQVWEEEVNGYELAWHTENLAGEYLANGVYLYRVQIKVAGLWISTDIGKIAILR